MATVSAHGAYQRAQMLSESLSIPWDDITGTEETKEKKKGEVIHSGHFMVSSFAEEERDPDEEVELHNRDSPSHHEEVIQIQSQKQGYDFSNVPQETQNTYQFGALPSNKVTIDSSLSRLFDCMSLAYNGGKVTTPKWKSFKGLKLSVKDKIRLNNVIWRTWHMEYTKCPNPMLLPRRRKRYPIVQFITPMDTDAHNKPEAVIMEGKYWKRRIETVVAEYKRWRAYYMRRIFHIKQSEKSLYSWEESPSLAESMQIDPADFDDTLFSCLSQQPFAFPNPREIVYHSNNADCMQPGLLQLQPTLDTLDCMELEPLQDFLTPIKRSNFNSGNTNFLSASTYFNTNVSLPDNNGSYMENSYQSQLLKDDRNTLLEDLVQEENGMQTFLDANQTNVYSQDQQAMYSTNANASTPRKTLYVTPTTSQYITVNSQISPGVTFSTVPTVSDMPPPQKLPVRRKSGSSANQRVERLPQVGAGQQAQLQSVHVNNLTMQTQPTATNLHVNYHTNHLQQPQQSEYLGQVVAHPNTVKTMSSYNLPSDMQTHPAFINVPVDMTQQNKAINNHDTANYQTNAQVMTNTLINHSNNNTGDAANNLALQYVENKSWQQQTNPPQQQQTQVTITKQSPTTKHYSKRKTSSSTVTPYQNSKTVKDIPQQTILTQLLSKDHPNLLQRNKRPTDIQPTQNKTTNKSHNLRRSEDFSNPFQPPLSQTVMTITQMIVDDNKPKSTALKAKEEYQYASFPSSNESTDMLQMDSSNSSVPNSPSSEAHKQTAEQMRRFNIKQGFENLQQILPSNDVQSNAKLSKAALLGKAASHIQRQKEANMKNDAQIQKLKNEIEKLNNDISCCQQQLPITGAPVSRQRADRLNDMFEEWVRERTKEEWKFYIFSMIIRNWFKSFNQNVSISSKDELYQTTLAWLDKNCSLPSLRKGVVNSLQELSTSTAILSDPDSLPLQVENAVQDKQNLGTDWTLH